MRHGKPCVVLLFVVNVSMFVIKITLLSAAHVAEVIEGAVFTLSARRVSRLVRCIRSNPFTLLSGARSEPVLRACAAGGEPVLTTIRSVVRRILRFVTQDIDHIG